MRTALSLALLSFLVACGSTGTAGGTDAVVVGEVLGLEMTAVAQGGDALVILRTRDGLRTVRVPARLRECAARDIVALDSLRPGDRLEARGAARGRDLTPCASAAHYLRRASD